ncbi:MAG: MFS transporter small subunit [Motilibacteraceae bacterium]
MSAQNSQEHASGSQALAIALSWALVVVPLLYGLEQTLTKAAKLFTG